MVGLADIPCVGKAVDRISDAAVDTIFRGFRYLFRYKDLVKALDSQVEKANTEEERVSRKVAAERANGKIIVDRVFKWQKQAEEMKESAEKFAEKYKNRHSWRCIQCLPIPNPVSRFRLGREAVKKTERLTELINSGKELLANEIAHLAPDENLPKSNTEFQDFQSRKDAYVELWHSLINDSSPILGIYGMPGVGKTRMTEQLWKEAKEKMIFNKVARGNVGNEKLDVIQLQKQIAGHLDCKFDSEDNEESRASQLKQSISSAGKTLVILDDVWREIPLDVIGISCGDENTFMGSKILFTSREKDACLHNNCKSPVKITPLSDDETWDQFSNVVSTVQINSLQDESLAKKVCKKCKGLPLLIHAVGKALKFKSHSSWVDALKQLEKGNFENISGIDPQVYACVTLSIDELQDDAKSCLFLCCLFPEDADIPITQLIQLATGSQLVSDGEDRVLSIVDTLRSSSLLLDCEQDDSIKLHDLIRDVGRSIAFKDSKYAFLQVTCGVRLPDNADFGTRKFLRLDVEGYDVHMPDDLVCPDLHSLWLKCKYLHQFSNSSFSTFANVRLLYIEGLFSSLEVMFSHQPLSKLRTLIIEHCDLMCIEKTNVSFFPKNLETLYILRGLLGGPLDLSYLKYLRKLEVKVWGLKFMPNTISSLSRLEELHIPSGFVIWRDESTNILKDGSGICGDDSSAIPKPILVEINQLTHLKSLQIRFETSEPFQDTSIFDNLELFNICVDRSDRVADLSYKTSVELQGDHLESLKGLLERAEYVKLECTNINASSIFNSNREAFTELRKLYLEECHNMEHLARISLSGIQHSQQKSFSKLNSLEIINCSTLRYLFCSSVAKCLGQLQKLIIKDCPVMEAIVINEGSRNGDIINFSNLKELELNNMPRFGSFYKENEDAMMEPSVQSQPLFGRMVEFPSLVDFKLIGCGKFNLEEIEFIWQLKSLDIRCDSDIQLPSKRQFPSNLETLILSGCLWHDLKSVCFERLKSLKLVGYSGCSALFTFSGFRSLQQLEELEILDCDFLEEIVEDDKVVEDNTSDEASSMNKKTITLSHLRSVTFKDLPKLKSFIHGANYDCYMPALGYMDVDNCGFSTLFKCNVFRNLQQLFTLKVSKCRLLEVIVEDERGDETSNTNDKTITLAKLQYIGLEHLPNLKSFSPSQSYAFNMPTLVHFGLVGCPRIENVTCLNTHTRNGFVLTGGTSEWKLVQDMNDFIKRLFKEEVMEEQRELNP